MLEITKTTVSKNGYEVVGDYTYNLSISIEDNLLNTILCQISKNVLVDTQNPEGTEPQKVEQNIQVGIIQLANGQISTQINSDEDSITHLMKFTEYLKKLEPKSTSKK